MNKNVSKQKVTTTGAMLPSLKTKRVGLDYKFGAFTVKLFMAVINGVL
jgi:hypothetical protein